jgi:hypothetical protein
MSPNAQRVGGVLHGGVIMAVLDETMGFAALTLNDGVGQVTVELKVNFLESGVEGALRSGGDRGEAAWLWWRERSATQRAGLSPRPSARGTTSLDASEMFIYLPNHK